ncbi:FkbM family methyltransferase [Pseudomonas sp. 8AS]|uniref:FkbM family methyltransferase n=1 Tax=Pseudomonas sp. 8AS TaxID=2653163 RepID=UPI00135715BE|nr:FkbM family methyltransferase [Pseudomonas sp. 8AS]
MTSPERADFFECCKRAGSVLLLAPSSYLGGIYRPLVVAELTRRIPSVRLIAVDDVLFANKAEAYGFDDVILLAQLREGHPYKGGVVVNCAYSLPTWLTFQQIAVSAQCECVDLPELLYLLDIPLVYQIGAVTRSQTLAHQAEFATLRERFEDDLSRRTLDAIMRMRMDGNRASLLDVLCSGEQEYFSLYRGGEHPIQLRTDEHYVDVGAYDGDTVKKFMAAVRHEFASIHAFEPDPANFKAMQDVLGDASAQGLVLHHQAVSDTDGFLSFAAKGTMGSRAEKGGDIQVPSIRLDDVLDDVTLLKMDVEGHEANVLRGGAQLIGRCRPRMAITCYHHALDLLDIVAVIDQIGPGASLRLRHYSMFFYDTILYVDWPTAAGG